MRREIQNLLAAIEQGDPPAPLLEHLQAREQEQASIEAELAAARNSGALTELDRRRIRGVLAAGLDHLGGVLAADQAAARKAMAALLPERIRFTPVALPTGERTYQFEAKLALGQITSLVRQNGVNVPDGI